jgi:hypothetical protein
MGRRCRDPALIQLGAREHLPRVRASRRRRRKWLPGKASPACQGCSAHSPDRGTNLIDHCIKRYFRQDHVRYYATLAIGFYLESATMRFDIEDCCNALENDGRYQISDTEQYQPNKYIRAFALAADTRADHKLIYKRKLLFPRRNKSCLSGTVASARIVCAVADNVDPDGQSRPVLYCGPP